LYRLFILKTHLIRLLRRYYDNYLLITIIVLIILPVLLAFSNFLSINYKLEIATFSLEYFNNESLAFQILSFFQYGVFVVMLILYPLYPSAFSVEKFFIKRNPETAIIEYEMLKKIVYALFPLFIFAFAYLIGGTMKENPLGIVIKFLGDSIILSLFVTIIGITFFIVGSALLKIILLIARKEFRFYFAKILFRALSKKEDEAEKIRYLVKALNSYNKYIRRTLGLEINDLKKVYSKILSDPALDKNHSIKELSIAFEDSDKFKTIKCLSGLLNATDTEHFLAKEPVGKKVEHWAEMLGTIVSTVAAIIGVLATIGVPGLS
jgi:hypothetical protein